MLNKFSKPFKVFMAVLVLLLVVIIALVLNFPAAQRSLQPEIIGIKDFPCSNTFRFTFQYPEFKGWEVAEIKNVGQSECSIFLSDEALKSSGISRQEVPQIRVGQLFYAGSQGKMPAPKYLKETSENGIHFNKTDTGYDFWTGDSVVHVDLLGTRDDYGFDGGQFFKKVVESFEILDQ